MTRDAGTGGPVALVMGGARGIGRACSELLVERGWRVAIADLDQQDEAQALSSIAPPDRLLAVTVDVTSTPSTDAAVASVLGAFGRLDALINCAGFNRHQPVAELEDATWQRLLDVHLGGTLRCCRAAFPALRSSGRGAVVNFSSMAAHIGRPRRAPYSAAKAGIEGLTRTLAVEWAPSAIRVNAVAPGVIRTRMVEANIEVGNVDEASLIGGIPLGRMGRAREIAGVVAFLIGEDAGYLTGQTLVVDGGATVNGDW